MAKVTLNQKTKKLIIELDANIPAEPSASGKMLILATTHGFESTTAEYKGQPIKISVNAGIKNNG